MHEIKRMAIETSQMILDQGVNLDIAGKSIQNTKEILIKAKKEIVVANSYEKDTNKKNMLVCLLIMVIVGVVMLLMVAARK